MAFKFYHRILVCSLILVFLLSMTGVSHAVLSMNEVQYLFEREKGQLWKDATSEERRDFVRDVRGREEFQEGELKGKKKELKAGSGIDKRFTALEDIKEKAPYQVRSGFEIETGIEWDDATEKEQNAFWKKYKFEEKKQKQEEKLYSRKKRNEERQRKREVNLKKRQRAREKKLRDQEEKVRRKKIRRKREADKKIAEKKKREWEAFRQSFRDRHK